MRDRQETPVGWIGIQCVCVYVWDTTHLLCTYGGNFTYRQTANQQTKAMKGKRDEMGKETANDGWGKNERKKMYFTEVEAEETKIYLHTFSILHKQQKASQRTVCRACAAKYVLFLFYVLVVFFFHFIIFFWIASTHHTRRTYTHNVCV